MSEKSKTRSSARSDTLPAKRPSLALALGGGGARGLAHILMLEVFDELGVKPAIISGSSIGAIFGAVYASGLSAAYIRAHTEETLSQRFDLMRQLIAARADPISKIFNFLPVRSSLLDPVALLDLILPPRVPQTFDDLAIPLRVVTSDFYAQEPVIFEKGNLRQAVAASMALPVVFSPVAWEGRLLMDGGLVNPLPFDIVTGDADATVAIDVSGAPRQADRKARPSAIESLFAGAYLFERTIVREKLKSTRPDIYIDVVVNKFHVLEFHHFKEVMAAAAPAKDQLKRQLARLIESDTLSILEAPQETDAAARTKAPTKKLIPKLPRRRKSGRTAAE